MDTKHPIAGPHFLNQELAKLCVPIIELTRADDPDLRKIIRMIGDIPAFSRRVLRTANAAIVGLHRSVMSVEQAVALLGPGRVRQIMERLQFELGHTWSGVSTQSSRPSAQ
jgi:HD-like signal output (HDOD) protein